MNNIDPLMAWILGLSLVLITMWIIIIFDRWRRKRRHKLHLQVHFHNKKHPFFMSVNTVTLTDLLPHTGVISVVDQNGVSYSGKLSNIVVAISDGTVDSAAVDPNQANTVDVTALVNAGGTTVAITADFTADQPINGQTTFTSLKGTVTVINQVAAEIQLSLQVNF